MKSLIETPRTSPEWKEEFEPIHNSYQYKKEIDRILLELILIDELNSTLKGYNLKSTLGPRILYKFYKNTSNKMKDLICHLFNIYIQNGTIPYK